MFIPIILILICIKKKDYPKCHASNEKLETTASFRGISASSTVCL